MKKIINILIQLIIGYLVCYPQATLPVIKPIDSHVPKPTIQSPTIPFQVGRQVNPHNPDSYKNIQLQNEQLGQEVEAIHIHNRRIQATIESLINNGFPSQSDIIGTSNYYNAFDEIHRMLKGEIPMNLGRAIFLTENAYYDNVYSYEDFKNSIDDVVELCYMKIKEDKLDREDNIVKNMIIFRMIADTLKIKDDVTGQTLYHYPVKYNYDDYESKKNFDSHYVTTLMRTRKGQCNSMPLYYLVLAEKMNAEAYWAFSPRHSFIKIKDENNVWYNLELTCKAILSDTHYMNNSYIKAEAIQNKLYLEPMDKRNVIAQMLIELARGYYNKYGLDDFYLKCLDTAKDHLDNKLEALMMRADYYTRLTLTLGHLLQAPNPKVMEEKSPEAYRYFILMQSLYGQIDKMGYEPLPEGVYANWLKYIAKEKEKSEKLPSIFINLKKEKLK